jgi:hypothetical protein
VETASVLYHGHWIDDAVVSLPGTVIRSPSEIEVTLIGVLENAHAAVEAALVEARRKVRLNEEREQ